MPLYPPPEPTAADRYVAALEELRAARARYVEARVPMELVDGEPPVLSVDQQAAVHGYWHAWGRFSEVMQEVATNTCAS